jgi:two-component system, sensor histidine kinase and response regulator
VQIAANAKILIVDDEPNNLLALEALLKGIGAHLVRAYSGNEALRRLLKEDFAVILMDVQMPGMDGLETAAMIRERALSRYTPIIFLTAAGRTEAEISRGYEMGAVDYLLKPIVPEILRQKVRVLVDLFQMNVEIKRLNVELKGSNAELERRVQERTADLEAQSRDLARSNQELAQFAAVASHDLQEPLRTLSTYLQLLGKNQQGNLNAEDQEIFDVVLDSARRMRQLISDLLAFSQIGLGERKPGQVDCAVLVEKVLDQIKEMVEERGAEIRVGPMPVLNAEPVLLGQVFQNLIGNALKFQKGGAPVVEVSARKEQERWVFGVRDEGIGIAPEHSEKVFKLFGRLHGRDEYPGNGLGLSLCKKVVERHGGVIWLDPTPSKGSTFYFSIPHSHKG